MFSFYVWCTSYSSADGSRCMQVIKWVFLMISEMPTSNLWILVLCGKVLRCNLSFYIYICSFFYFIYIFGGNATTRFATLGLSQVTIIVLIICMHSPILFLLFLSFIFHFVRNSRRSYHTIRQNKAKNWEHSVKSISYCALEWHVGWFAGYGYKLTSMRIDFPLFGVDREKVSSLWWKKKLWIESKWNWYVYKIGKRDNSFWKETFATSGSLWQKIVRHEWHWFACSLLANIVDQLWLKHLEIVTYEYFG